jgi:hypothetical protein
MVVKNGTFSPKDDKKPFPVANYLKRNGLTTKVRQFFFPFAPAEARKTKAHSLPLAI